MTRLRCLDCDLCGFKVANLANHDDVRVLPEEGAQRFSEIQSLLGVNVNLVNALKVDFYRVFSGRDIALYGIQYIESGIQRNGFP